MTLKQFSDLWNSVEDPGLKRLEVDVKTLNVQSVLR